MPLPLQIVRPSIIVGDRTTGWTRSFNVLYWPLQMFASGRLPVIPAKSGAPVDVVSVDYVADAILALQDAPPATYHAVAAGQASTVGDVIALASLRFGLPEPAVVPPERLAHALAAPLTDHQRRALDRARVYFPYFDLRVRFDDRRAGDVLAPAGVRAAPLPAYFDRLMDYAERTRWGRSPLPGRTSPRPPDAAPPCHARYAALIAEGIELVETTLAARPDRPVRGQQYGTVKRAPP